MCTEQGERSEGEIPVCTEQSHGVLPSWGPGRGAISTQDRCPLDLNCSNGVQFGT